jgi:hypothetical protein
MHSEPDVRRGLIRGRNLLLWHDGKRITGEEHHQLSEDTRRIPPDDFGVCFRDWV